MPALNSVSTDESWADKKLIKLDIYICMYVLILHNRLHGRVRDLVLDVRKVPSSNPRAHTLPEVSP